MPTITQVMDGRPCWEQMKGERGKAFAAFQHYRDQGPTRTMRSTAQMLIKTFDAAYESQEEEDLIAKGGAVKKKKKMSGVKKESTAIGTLHSWATKYEWQARAEFFDIHMDRIRIETMERDTRDMTHRHIEFSTILIDISKTRLEEIKEAAAKKDGEKLSATEALKFGIEGVKIERMTRLKQSELTGIVEPAVPGEETSQNPREILKGRIDAIAERKRQERERVAAAAVTEEAPVQMELQGKPDLRIVSNE